MAEMTAWYEATVDTLSECDWPAWVKTAADRSESERETAWKVATGIAQPGMRVVMSQGLDGERYVVLRIELEAY